MEQKAHSGTIYESFSGEKYRIIEELNTNKFQVQYMLPTTYRLQWFTLAEKYEQKQQAIDYINDRISSYNDYMSKKEIPGFKIH